MNATILTSQAWRDLVFEGRNKSYGAYQIRKDSSSRHFRALLAVVGLTLLFVFGVNFAAKVHASNLSAKDDSGYGSVQITEVNTTPLEEIKPVFIEPEKPIVASVKFVPPVVVPDDQVTEADRLKSQVELNENPHAVIAGVDHKGNTDGPGMVATDLDPVIVETPVETVFTHVEQMPIFPGGDKELISFLGKNLKYPVIAQDQGIHGTVTLRFVVGKDGNVGDIEILKSLDPSCDREAVRVVKSMPQWVPGKQNGKAVMVFYTLPVRFRLAN